MSTNEILFSREEVAIVGMAARFPGAVDIKQFWENLWNGVSSIRSFSIDELRASGIDEATLSHPSFVNSGAVIEDADCFDATFFGFSPLEAEVMDPQQRIFLECAWETLEDAGYDPFAYKGAIGVFGGVSPNTYFQNNLMARPDVLKKIGPQLTRLSNEKDHLCTRVAFKLNLKGPGINVNTACSSSGVALHLATQSILSGECDMALVGGVRVEAPLKAGYLYEEGGILSPDGQCRVFDAEARGTVFGNGVCMVLVKRLSEAFQDGDTIHAVIKGTAINNDGSRKAGYAAPSVQGQAAVIEEALAMAEINADTIGYLEAHGTGTSLGDPIEIAALTKAFRQSTERKGFCPIGSVKSNIGHLFAGAGIAGVIKTVLSLKHRLIPPSLNFTRPNPQIDFKNSPFFVNDTLREWESDGRPRRAGVSSFGLGGTNAHIILEEAPPVDVSDSHRGSHLVVLSARSETALDAATARLADHLKAEPDTDMADVAFTLQQGRKPFNYRRILVSGTRDAVVTAFETMDPQRVVTYGPLFEERDVGFMFSGQGAQYANMGLGLYQAEAKYRRAIDRCADILKPHIGRDIRDVMFPTAGGIELAGQELKNTLITQPALFTVEYALAQLWMAWGVRPAVLIGHSIGEYVAACLAGVFSLEDALALVAARGRLIQSLPGGAMLAVPLSEKDLEPYLGADVSLAVVNGPEMCVASGDTGAVGKLENSLRQLNVQCRHLHTSHAFHSKMMDPIIDQFAELVHAVSFDIPRIPIVSTVTGKSVQSDEIMEPAYWVKNLRQTVRFSDGLVQLMSEPNRILLEVGPGQTLGTLARQHPNRSNSHIVLSSMRHPYETTSDIDFILNTLGWLWLAGVTVDWKGFYAGERRQRISLPTYPFERKRYWVEPEEVASVASKPVDHPEKKNDVADWFHIPSWKQCPLPRAVHPVPPSSQKRNCLVFVDHDHIAVPLVQRLQEAGYRVSTVESGSDFRTANDRHFIVNPKAEDDYHQLVKRLRESDQLPDIILHCWNLVSQFPSDSAEDFGFNSLLFLTKSMGDVIPDMPVDIKILSSQLYDVTGDEKLIPEKATLLGPCLVIPQEYQGFRCVNIDIGIGPDNFRTKDDWCDMLIAELNVDTSASIVAYRGKHRWIRHYEPVRLQSREESIFPLKSDGVYLITGGLGGIGLTIAEYLAEKVSPRLILTGRASIPDREQWPQSVKTHNPSDDIIKKIRRVMDIEKCGAEILAVSADVTNLQQMQEIKRLAYEQFGRIDGVFHAAGIAGGGVIQLKSAVSSQRVLEPKVKGTLNLWRIFDDVPLDFFVMCSSVSAIRGGIGQVDYCAANAFLDAFAHTHSLRHTVKSINWGMWQQVGMGVNTEVPDDMMSDRRKRLELGILPEEGKEALDRILMSSLPQIIVSSQDSFNLSTQRKIPSAPAAEKPDANTISNRPTHMRPNLSSVYVVPSNPAEVTIAEIWQQLLGIESVGIHDNFFELGGHSILGTQLIERMRETFGVKFPLSTLFEKPTVHLLSELIQDSRQDAPSFAGSSSRGRKRKERMRRR